MTKMKIMKKLSILMLAICSTVVFGQKVSDYKYVSIPEKLDGFKKESFGLENFLTKTLKGKGYVILASSIDQWPAEARDNSCNILNADILNDSSMFTNKVILKFTDCNKKIILESKGRSDIKEFETGYPDALKQALMKVGVSNPVNILPPAQTQTINTSSNSSASNVVDSSDPVASNYSNGKVEVQKIQIDANQFILAKSGSSVPFAIFRTTSKKDVFIVKLSDNTTTVTIGYFENENLVIDIPQPNGTYLKEVFTKK